MGQEQSMEEDKPEQMPQQTQENQEPTKVQQVEIVEKEGENTQAIPIPIDAQEAQVFKLDDKIEDEEWDQRSFLPNGQGRGGVFNIPQNMREAQIFTVSDARAGVPVGASFDVASDEKGREARVMEQPEGEMSLPNVPEHSVRLYPVEEPAKAPEQAEERTETMEETRPHFVHPRSV